MLLGIGPDGPVRGRRVAITGIGVVSCCGVGTDALWTGLNGPPPVGERRVPDFDPEVWFTAKEARQVDRFTQFCVAVTDRGTRGRRRRCNADPGRSGVVMGTGVGGLESLESQILLFGEKGPRRVSPRLVPMMMSNAGAAAVSIRLGWHGPSETVTTACAAGAHSIAAAARLVASGRCDVAIGGAAEAGMTKVGIAAFTNMTALSTSGDSRPFDIRRDGFVITEGAGALVLEAWDHAVARGARIYGELCGSASTADAHHITAPIPGGSGAAACMTLAMEDAGVTADADRAHQRARDLHPLERSRRGRRDHQGLREPRATGDLDQGHHRPRARGERCHRGRRGGAQHPSIGSSRRPPGTSSPTRRSPSTSWPAPPGPGSPAPVLSNSFGFGGHNGCLVIGPA